MSETDNKALEMVEDIQAAALNEKIASARQGLDQTKDPRFVGWDGKACFDCGNGIPSERLAMKRVRCVQCQTAAERKGRG